VFSSLLLAPPLPATLTARPAKTHTHPVYCIDVVGSQNAHNLVTVSTDGRLCSWNLDMLSEPQESVELQCTTQKNAAATCLSFPHGVCVCVCVCVCVSEREIAK
jgi:dynein intermediate chain, cytosolic